MADQTARIKLLEPVLDRQSIHNTNFFNGRLLTAGDLQDEQEADRRHRAQLGQAVGDGVVTGLVVTLVNDGSASGPDGGMPVVRVSGGLALNRCGQALALPTTVEIALSTQADPLPQEAGLFAVCQRLPSAPGTDRGVFLLVLTPSSAYREQAPRRGLGTDDSINGCGPRYAVEGVSFRLETFDPSDLLEEAPEAVAATLAVKDRTDRAGLALHQNLLAHLCFGTEPLASFADDPFQTTAEGRSPFEAYGAVDVLRRAGALTDCEVPLALIYWPASGVKFVDTWAVRRRLIQPLIGDPWPPHVGQRRLAEAEAVFLQFQEQLRGMLDGPNPGTVAALERFHFLPPAGYLPIGPGELTFNAFFNGLTVNTQTLDTSFLRLLIQQSWYLDPIDLTSPPTLRVYAPPGQPGYLVFVREEDVAAEHPVPPSDSTQPGPTSTTGKIEVFVSLYEPDFEATPGRLLHKTQALGKSLNTLGITSKQAVDVAVKANHVLVYAVDALGKQYPAQNVPLGASSLPGKGGTIVVRRGVVRFLIPSLPPGVYTVFVKVLGFKTASRQATVTAGQSTRIRIVLVPDGGKGGHTLPPSAGLDVPWVEPGWFGKGFVVGPHLEWPWPPKPDILDKFETVVDPPPPWVDPWVEGWVDHFRAEFPDVPLDPGGARFVVSKTHTPDQVADEPYAYLVFGDSGAYVPVILTAKDQSLDRPVALSRGDLPGVELGTADRFREAGVISLDMLAAGWTGLVSEVLDVGPDAAGRLLTTARDRVGSLQGSLRVFDGVRALEEALKDAGIDGPTALANAEPQTLATTLGPELLSPALAHLLVDEARAVVPSSQWSLASPQLGLKEPEIAAIKAGGIATLGQLLQRTQDDAGKETVGGLLGISGAQVGTLVGGVVIADAASLARERRGETAVTDLVGIDRKTGLALARLGFGRAGSLANADPAVLAGVFGGDAARAAAVIGAAKAHVEPVP